MPCTWIIIVNYRTAELVIDLLNSLEPGINILGGGRVAIVDNDSGDDSVNTIEASINQQGWGDWASVIPMESNGGFAYGNNAGIELAKLDAADYVMLLNPDTIVKNNAVAELVSFMENNPKVGIAGSLLEDKEGKIDCSAHKFHSPLSELDSGARLGVLTRLLKKYVVSEVPKNQAHSCDWVSGASMVIRAKVINDIGLMDENYFLYYEEVDYCWRAKKAGWDIWYVPESRVCHLEGASTGIKTKSKRRAGYWYDSRRRFFLKYYGVIGLIMADIFWGIGRISLIVRTLLRLGGKGISDDPKWYMYDLLVSDVWSLLSRRAWSIRQESRG